MLAQPYPITPSQHGQLLHPLKRKGKAFLGRKLPEWDQNSWYPWELDAVLHDLAGEQDVYLTQNRFTGRRKALQQHICELSALWTDLDYYNVPELAGRAPEAVFELALERLQGAGVPEPSLVTCSGQGLYLVWLHTPVGRKEFPKWQDCQYKLLKLLEPLGADGAARDAARVLRLVGTRNSKNGGLVYSLRDAGPCRSFDELAESLLLGREDVVKDEDLSGASLNDLRVRSAVRRVYKAPRRYSERSLWHARWRDLQTLREIRFGEGQMSDFRDRWLFLAGVAMSWITDPPEPAFFERELLGLAEEVGGWDEDRSRSKLQAVFERVGMAARGETVLWEGDEWDPRFHFKNETIMDWLKIAADEERHMVTLIGEAERRRRDKEYRREKRSAEGVQARAQYERQRTASLQENRAAARKLKKGGLSTKEIASERGVSERTVQRWLQH